jgi:hypothetical protein
MCYLGVGTTPLKRGVKPPQSAFLDFSGVQADPTNVVEGSVASMDKVAETANGVFEDTADGIVVSSDAHSCGKRDGSLVQVVSCGWKAQPRFCTNADLWLVLIRFPKQRIGYLRIPLMESWF